MPISGFNPNTDIFQRSADPFSSDIVEVRRQVDGTTARGTAQHSLRIRMPGSVWTNPLPQEFIWRPLKLLYSIDVWWSLYRPTNQLEHLISHYQLADGFEATQMILLEAVRDEVAWPLVQDHMLNSLLIKYHEAFKQQDKESAAEQSDDNS